MSKQNKRPGKLANPGQSKMPRTARTDPQSFRWRTNCADLSDPEWGWGQVDIPVFFRDIAQKLHQLEDSIWEDMIGHDQVHFIPSSEIAGEARKRLGSLVNEEIIPDDLTHEDLASFRVGARARVWGFKVGKNFNLLWWDPNHSVYPVGKRHT